MPTSRPQDVRKNYIQEEDVRRWVGDLVPHDLLGGQAFNPDDINTAMRFAVMAYNEFPPQVHSVTVDTMPFSFCFLNLIADMLFTMRIRQLSHELLEYKVGDMQYNDKETRIKSYTAVQTKAEKDWKEAAAKIKQRQNLEDGYDTISSPFAFWIR